MLISNTMAKNGRLFISFCHLRYTCGFRNKSYYKNNQSHRNTNEKIRYSLCGILFGSLLYFKLKKSLIEFDRIEAYCSTKEFKSDEISKHKSKETGIWVTYQNKVYDISDFVDKHPGGDKIFLAAGGALEPFWSLYAVHQNNKEVHEILKQYEIGVLAKESHEANITDLSDPFETDPKRHPALRVVSNKPFNAETPSELLADNFVTPNPLFFVRNHLPVPVVDIKTYRLSLEGIGLENKSISLHLNQIKRISKSTSIESTIMCSGNRRYDMFKHKPVRGLAWNHGAISNAKWTGIRLVDFFAYYKLSYQKLMESGAKHIQFEGLDSDVTGARYGASIPIEIALDPRSDILLAWDMNDEELSPDHGYPLRVIIPGIVGARQVKWLSKIVISDKESDSFWQQNDYKTFSPNVDFETADYSSMPPIMESNVQSAICVPRDGQSVRNEGVVNVKGYAWSGAGRGIIRVELSTDNGMNWIPAVITHSKDAPISSHINRRQWCWSLWEADLPLADDCRELEIICKAVDSSQNTQPESYKGTWNVRGLMANAWHKIKIQLCEE